MPTLLAPIRTLLICLIILNKSRGLWASGSPSVQRQECNYPPTHTHPLGQAWAVLRLAPGHSCPWLICSLRPVSGHPGPLFSAVKGRQKTKSTSPVSLSEREKGNKNERGRAGKWVHHREKGHSSERACGRAVRGCADARGPASTAAQLCPWRRLPAPCRNPLPLGHPDPTRQKWFWGWGQWELREGGPAGALQPQAADCPQLPVELHHVPSCVCARAQKRGTGRCPQLCL